MFQKERKKTSLSVVCKMKTIVLLQRVFIFRDMRSWKNWNKKWNHKQEELRNVEAFSTFSFLVFFFRSTFEFFFDDWLLFSNDPKWKWLFMSLLYDQLFNICWRKNESKEEISSEMKMLKDSLLLPRRNMQNIKAVNENLRAAFSDNGERKITIYARLKLSSFFFLEMTFDGITQQIIVSFL